MFASSKRRIEDMKKEMMHLAKQLFSRRKRSAIPTYTKRFATLEKLIADDRIGIDSEQKLVVLDASIHALYMDDDRKYIAFFDTVQAYMNMCRGAIGIKKMIEHTDKIDFMVVMKRYKYLDMETGDFFENPEETTKTVLIGYCQNRELRYQVYEENTKIA